MENGAREKILNFIQERGKARAEDIRREFGYSRGLIHRYLKNLLDSGLVHKAGKAPLVFYIPTIPSKETFNEALQIEQNKIDFVNSNYLYITAQGEIIPGFSGFKAWVEATKQTKFLPQLTDEYIKTRSEANKYFDKDGFINATEKVISTFSANYLAKVLYLDFYSLPKFGKTRLGQLVLHAKQSQKQDLIKQVAVECQKKINILVSNYNIQAIAFIPPTLPRQVQFIKELEQILNIPLPKINLVKAYKGDVLVAQKTLSKLEERVENARNTIFTKGGAPSYENVLIIDDAVGSGASLNETAKKLITENAAKKVYGFALVGSYKGFDVIREI